MIHVFLILYKSLYMLNTAIQIPQFNNHHGNPLEVHFTHRVDLEPLIKAQKAAFEAKVRPCFPLQCVPCFGGIFFLLVASNWAMVFVGF